MRRIAIILALAALAAGAAAREAAATPSCAKVPLSEVKATLGIPLTSAHRQATGGMAGLSSCVYGTAANPQDRKSVV